MIKLGDTFKADYSVWVVIKADDIVVLSCDGEYIYVESEHKLVTLNDTVVTHDLIHMVHEIIERLKGE